MLETMKKRFFDNMERHPGINWEDVEKLLKANDKALTVLKLMEDTGGEPDTIGIDEATGKIIFCDCSPETPAGRRSL